MNKTHSAENAGRSASKQQDIFQSITDAIVARIEAGTAPWQLPWNIQHDFPRNFVTGRRYSGANLWLLLGLYDNPYYLTFKQVKDLGGSVIKGQRSHTIVYYRYSFYDTLTGEDLTYDQYKSLAEDRRSVYSVFRTYNVFNIRQTTLEFTLDKTDTFEDLPALESVYANMPNKPMLHHGNSSAYYIPSLDEIHLPDKLWFNSSNAYYQTLFHELVHSTGHKSRLSRDGIINSTNFGSELYLFPPPIKSDRISIKFD
jgi:antirestriction protein ArdC